MHDKLDPQQEIFQGLGWPLGNAKANKCSRKGERICNNLQPYTQNKNGFNYITQT